MLTVRPKPSSDDVSAVDGRHDDRDVDTRTATASVSGRRWSVLRPTRTETDSDRSATGRPHRDWALSPLYVGVPVACACVVLTVAVIGVLLVRYGRDRRVDGRGKSAALLPSSRSSLPSPSRQLTVELSESHEPCICLQCNRPVFVPASIAYSPVETRS